MKYQIKKSFYYIETVDWTCVVVISTYFFARLVLYTEN